ncbi:MAG: dimethylsulfonioproprionate lyase family protein [Rhizobiaceae bacterium]
MSQELFNDASWLIASIMRGLMDFPEDAPGVHEILSRIADQDLSADNFSPAPPQRLPGLRHLPEAVTAGVIVSMDLCHAIATIEDHLHWTQGDLYSKEEVDRLGFAEHAAYAEIIGTDGFFKGDDFRMGLMLLGPGLHYVDHYHRAPELYWLLTGPIEYSRSQAEFKQLGTHSTIWNEPNEVHAMKTGERPLLCVWAWANDVNELPVLLPA